MPCVNRFVLLLLSVLVLASCAGSTPTPSVQVPRFERPWPEVVAEAYRLADEQGLVDPFIGSLAFGYDAYDVPDNVAKHVDHYEFLISTEQVHTKIRVDIYSSVDPTSAFNPLTADEVAALQSGRIDDAIYRIRISPNMILEQAEPLFDQLIKEAPLRSPPRIGMYLIAKGNSDQLLWNIDASNNTTMLFLSIDAETGEIVKQEIVPEPRPI